MLTPALYIWMIHRSESMIQISSSILSRMSPSINTTEQPGWRISLTFNEIVLVRHNFGKQSAIHLCLVVNSRILFLHDSGVRFPSSALHRKSLKYQQTIDISGFFHAFETVIFENFVSHFTLKCNTCNTNATRMQHKKTNYINRISYQQIIKYQQKNKERHNPFLSIIIVTF